MPKKKLSIMKKNYNIYYLTIFYLLFIFVFGNLSAHAQSIDYQQFMQAVVEKNVAYLAEKCNVDIATANMHAARVGNDPELSVEYGNNQDWNLRMGQSVEVGLSYDLDLSGNRKARISTAKIEKDITEASVEAYLCGLRSEASQAWAEAWRLREACSLQESLFQDMVQIAQSDSVRLSHGDVSRTDAAQSRLEAQTMCGELTALRAEYRNALVTLSQMAGGLEITAVEGKVLPIEDRIYSESDLCLMAEGNRADLRAAELSRSLSESNLKLVKAARGFDMSLSLGYSYNTEVRNELAPAPKYHGLSIGVTIPLKFSNSNKGELCSAKSAIEQSRLNYESARLQVRAEVVKAYNSLMAARKVHHQYNDQLVADARSIMESRKMGYLKGESSLLELLAARQTYNEVMQAYVSACQNCFVCEVLLKQAVGL